MPALPSPVALASAAPSTASSPEILSVICAYPVSGQYGPGSRILYYVLVAGCVLGRGSAWLRGACLAAALLLPAVAALHGIVLAAAHVDGAVDMDVYGAFQLCAIGVLAGPVTVKLSGTYFNAPGRNLIFLWTTIILAGLLSLTVEFYRSMTPRDCSTDDFSWNTNGESQCGLTCDTQNGPFSPLRSGAQNNIYVITTPTVFTFGAATLVCAACCIPPVLSLVSMWNKILQENWKKRFGKDTESDVQDRHISGTNAATPRRMMNVNQNIRFYLKMVEIPIFGLAILAILIMGERNFFDYTVNFQTEPIQSIGQWGPIVGTGLAALGSLYALLAAEKKDETNTISAESGEHHCNCTHHHYMTEGGETPQIPLSPEMEERRTPDELDIYPEGMTLSPQNTFTSMHPIVSPISGRHLRQTSTTTSGAVSGGTHDLMRSPTSGTTSRGVSPGLHDLNRSSTSGTVGRKERGSRHKFARALEQMGQKLGTPAPGAFDDSAFQRGLASDFPEVPGERERNSNLAKIKAVYDPARNSEGLATPLRRQHSRTGSMISVSSGGEGGDESGVSEPPTPGGEAAGPRRTTIGKLHQRRATLQVPAIGSSSSPKQRRSTFSSSITIPPGPASPVIRVSEHQDDAETDDNRRGNEASSTNTSTADVESPK